MKYLVLIRTKLISVPFTLERVSKNIHRHNFLINSGSKATEKPLAKWPREIRHTQLHSLNFMSVLKATFHSNNYKVEPTFFRAYHRGGRTLQQGRILYLLWFYSNVFPSQGFLLRRPWCTGKKVELILVVTSECRIKRSHFVSLTLTSSSSPSHFS